MTTTTKPTSVEHASFVLDRTYPVTPERVWAAWATLEAKSRWFGDPDAAGETSPGEHVLDFQVGGHEYLAGSAPNGSTYVYDATFLDIVENDRIVAAYHMLMDGRRISVSLYTMQLLPSGAGTTLRLTEQGAFLDGLDTNVQREGGTNELLDQLGDFLAASA
jgi:uncharacterized protein YndB with AHSA1/START domain